MIVKKKRMTASFSSEYCCRYDSCLTVESAPEELAPMFGYSKEEMAQLCQKGLLSFMVEAEREIGYGKICCQLRKSNQVEFIFQANRKDGTEMWVMNRGCLVKEEDGQEYIHGVLVDLTWSKFCYDKEKAAEKVLYDQVGKDSLTNLYNASTSRKLAEEYFAESCPDGQCALLIIDLDDFKKVNDQRGHMFGDAVLIQVARAIRKLFRAKDIVGRIGGDEFMVLMKDVSDKEIVKKRCCQLNDILKTVFDEEFSDFKPTCSIGVGFAPEHGDSYFTVFCCADQALYRAKAAGRQQYMFYDEDWCRQQGQQADMQYASYDTNVLKGYLE